VKKLNDNCIIVGIIMIKNTCWWLHSGQMNKTQFNKLIFFSSAVSSQSAQSRDLQFASGAPTVTVTKRATTRCSGIGFALRHSWNWSNNSVFRRAISTGLEQICVPWEAIAANGV
jgi:hypothetical protein